MQVGFGHPPEVYKAHHLFEEKDWTNPDPSAPTPVSAYVRSKRYVRSARENVCRSLNRVSRTQAEKAAWDFHAALPADKTFELAVVNPSGVYGPVMFAEQDSTSVNILGVILKREMPMVPASNHFYVRRCVSSVISVTLQSLEMNIVDIRDVVQVSCFTLTVVHWLR
jgi:nucleoside-diphosphate-sugar epimerase